MMQPMKDSPPQSFAGWLTRHGLAAIAGLAWPPVAAAVAYGVLLLAAIIFNQGIGGPLALPAMVLMGVIYAFWVVFAVAWPSVALAEILVKADGFKPAFLRLLAALAMGVVLAIPWALLGAGAAVPGHDGGTGGTALLLAGAALPAIFLHWFIARSLRTVFSAGRGLSTVIARRWPGPGSGVDTADSR
jgi:hypothetical protein